MMMGALMFWLLFGHALGDFPLQGPFLARAKRRLFPEGANGFWVFALTAHAMIHAGMVAIAMNLVGWVYLPALMPVALLFGVGEFIAHWLIDWSKCEDAIGMVEDQLLHIACKIAWAGIAVLAVS